MLSGKLSIHCVLLRLYASPIEIRTIIIEDYFLQFIAPYTGKPGYVGRSGYVGQPGYVGPPGYVGSQGYVGNTRLCIDIML